tara:strand:+ start:1342 stop:2019 length:678 start_codon:yes stop_codon:yes gene_type:complete
MLSLDFGTVLNGVAQLAGLDRDNLPGHFFKQVRDLANRRLAIAWIAVPWPDLVRVLNLTGTNDVFTLTSGIGEVIEVYSKDPLTTTEAVPVSFRLYDTGSARQLITRGGQSSVYVEYRITRTDLTGDVWAAGTYNIGVQAYNNNNFYTVNASSTTQEPPHANWDKVEISSRFTGYLIQGIYSDYLKSNGTKDDVEDVKAEEILSLEIDSVLREQGQIRKTIVATY